MLTSLHIKNFKAWKDTGAMCEARAKLVRPDFTQAIETHWRKRAIEWNRVGSSEERA